MSITTFTVYTRSGTRGAGAVQGVFNSEESANEVAEFLKGTVDPGTAIMVKPTPVTVILTPDEFKMSYVAERDFEKNKATAVANLVQASGLSQAEIAKLFRKGRKPAEQTATA